LGEDFATWHWLNSNDSQDTAYADLSNLRGRKTIYVNRLSSNCDFTERRIDRSDSPRKYDLGDSGNVSFMGNSSAARKHLSIAIERTGDGKRRGLTACDYIGNRLNLKARSPKLSTQDRNCALCKASTLNRALNEYATAAAADRIGAAAADCIGTAAADCIGTAAADCIGTAAVERRRAGIRQTPVRWRESQTKRENSANCFTKSHFQAGRTHFPNPAQCGNG
jgi:hypothetical protein